MNNKDNTENQRLKAEFMMVRSCERRKNEMIYKDINRNFIPFDLADSEQMAQVGRSLKPFGFLGHLKHKCHDSGNSLLKIWSETSLAREGAAHIRRLYKEQPEKFFDVNFAKGGNSIELSSCKLIVSEIVSQKVVSLQNEDFHAEEMKNIRNQLTLKENGFAEEQRLAEEFSPEPSDDQTLITQYI